MTTLPHHLNGSKPEVFRHVAQRIAPRGAAEAALSPTVGDILSPELRASLHGVGGPTQLWCSVLAAANSLNASTEIWALLNRTRLEVLAAWRFVVRIPCDASKWASETELRRLLNTALRAVGLTDYRVALVFAAEIREHDAET